MEVGFQPEGRSNASKNNTRGLANTLSVNFQFHVLLLPNTLYSFQHFYWTNSAPLTYQYFKNWYFNKLSLVDKIFIEMTSFTRKNNPYCTEKSKFGKQILKHEADIPYKMGLSRTLLPHHPDQTMCLMMFLANPGEPDWLFVFCDDHITADVYCSISSNSTEKIEKSSHHQKTCAQNSIYHLDKCYTFS